MHRFWMQWLRYFLAVSVAGTGLLLVVIFKLWPQAQSVAWPVWAALAALVVAWSGRYWYRWLRQSSWLCREVNRRHLSITKVNQLAHCAQGTFAFDQAHQLQMPFVTLHEQRQLIQALQQTSAAVPA